MRTGTRVLLGCALAAAIWLSAGSALALQVDRGPAHVLDGPLVTVRTGGEDATGTATLLLDGAAVRAWPSEPETSVAFGQMKLPSGVHQFVVRLHTRAGTVFSAPVSVQVWSRPLPPVLMAPKGYAAGTAAVTARAGLDTTSIRLYLNARLVRTVPCSPGAVVSLGTITLAAGDNRIELVGVNPVAASQPSVYSVRRLDYPWPTCIIIDKSECRLYWIRDGILVKTYPIAIGKPSTPTPIGTWRIGNKYMTDPNGIYGPRKMRMYRLRNGRFEFTAYNIHGTNQPWVIGTMASHGCIRMYNREVLELYPQVPLGTMVQTRE